MTLRLHDTASRDVREFTPVRPGTASVYVCGPTVQSDPHIGHARSALVFDILRRWLTHSGLDVTFIRNVTDIDDKILVKSAEAGIPWWAWADIHERQFDAAYRMIGVLPATYSPRATGHVPEMIELMERLLDRGHAYAPGDGDVYFDVRSWPDYGALSRQRLGDMQAAPDSDSSAKRDARDFALWKGAKEGGPFWATPWGNGRPGWHLECSAMAVKYCGAEFDIHGGGLDLVFPHHENELAQARAAGDPFTRFWMHNSWVTQAGEKMSKSLGNSMLVSEMVKLVRPVELRYYLGSAHYRSMLEYSQQALQESATAYRRIEAFVRRATDRVGPVVIEQLPAPPAFTAAMDDDLGVPAALAVLHEQVTRGNEALSAGDDVRVRSALATVRLMAAILGFDPADPVWSAPGQNRADAALDGLVRRLLEQRAEARAAKDYAAADTIRQHLQEVGLSIEDRAGGSSWSFDESR